MGEVLNFRFVQYIVTYKDQKALERIKEKANITYSSVVVNLAIVESLHTRELLLGLEGVLSVVHPKKYLWGHKRR